MTFDVIFVIIIAQNKQKLLKILLKNQDNHGQKTNRKC